MAIQTRESTGTNAMVDELLRANRVANTADLLESVSTAYIALGAAELLAGLLALSAPFLTSVFFAFLMGAALLAGGVTGAAGSALKRSWGRFILGASGIIAGALLMAHPLFDLNFMTGLVSSYLIVGGIGRLVSGNESGWMVVSGIASFVFGILLLAGWPSSSQAAAGIYTGVSLMTGGVATMIVGNEIRRRLLRVV